MFSRKTQFVVHGLRVCTDGLSRRNQKELCISVNDANLVAEAKEFLRFVVRYLDESNRQIVSGETLRYGYWLVKFIASSAEPSVPLETWEYNSEATDFVRNGYLTVQYWKTQHEVCRRYNAIFSPPDPESLTAISVGVLEGRPAQGLRYPWPGPMSGWLMVTDDYDGDVRSLTRHHTYHVTSARPDVAPYIALPPGFGFDLRKTERVWYDEAAVREHLKEFFGDEGLAEAGFPIEKK